MSRKAKEAGQKADELIAEQARIKAQNTEGNLDQDDTDLDEPLAPTNPEVDLDLSQDDDLNLDGIDDDQEKDDHKYNVLQGKYNAETERLSNMLSQVMTENQQLKDRLDIISQGSNIDLNNVASDDPDLESLKTEYPKLYKGFLALAKNEMRGALKKTEDKVDGFVARSVVTEREKYYKELTGIIPQWNKINVHPSFTKWLMAKDKFSGQSKQSLLRSAYDRMDVEASAAFFESFMAEKGIKNQNSEISDSESIAPNTSGIGTGTRQIKPGSITRAEIAKCYSDRARGKFN